MFLIVFTEKSHETMSHECEEYGNREEGTHSENEVQNQEPVRHRVPTLPHFP